MDELSNNQIKKASEWFTKFCALLESRGIDTNNPYALGLVGITTKVEPKKIDVETAGFDEIGNEINRLDGGEHYAFMKRKDDDSYVVPRPAEGSTSEWLSSNLRTAKELTDEDKLNLYQHFLDGNLYICGDTITISALTKRFPVFEDNQGRLQVTEQFDELWGNANVNIQDAQRCESQLQEINGLIDLANRGKKLGLVPITEEEAESARSHIAELRVELNIRLKEKTDGVYYDGTPIPEDKLNEIRRRVTALNRELDKLEEMERDKVKQVEQDMTPEEQASTLEELNNKRALIMADLSAIKSRPAPYETIGMTAEQFSNIGKHRAVSFSLSSSSRTLTRDFSIKYPQNRYEYSIERNNLQRAEKIKNAIRSAFVNRLTCDAERNLCIIGKNYKEWVDNRGTKEIYDAFLTSCIHTKFMTEQEKEFLKDKPYTDVNFSASIKSMLKKTGTQSLDELARSGLITRPDNSPYPTGSYEFIAQVYSDSTNGNGIAVQYKDKSGAQKKEIFQNTTDMGLKRASDVSQYRKHFAELKKELLSTDFYFSRDSMEYKNLKAQLESVEEKLNNNTDRFSTNLGMNDIWVCIGRYGESHKNLKHLSNRQQRRLAAMRKLNNLVSMARNDVTYPDSAECKISMLAGKVVCAQAREMLNDKKLEAEGKNLLLDEKAFAARQKSIINNPAFRKMVMDTGMDNLERLMEAPDAKLMKQMDSIANDLMKSGPTEEAMQYTDNGPNPRPEFKEASRGL